MIKQKVKGNKTKDLNRALKTFKKRVFDSKIMIELRERQYYKKKSQKRREQKNKAKLREKIRRESE